MEPDTNPTFRLARTVRLGITGAVAIAVLAACGGGDDSSDVDLDDVASYLAPAAVCNGTPQESAAALVPGALGRAFVTTGDGTWQSGGSFMAGLDRNAILEEESAFTVCVTVTSATEADRCEYEDEGDEFTLIIQEGEYDVEVREAATAEVIGSATMSGAHDGECPLITTWTIGEGERISYAVPETEIAALVAETIG